MASRKEEKERLRREREERERQAQEANQRRRLIGYGVGGVLVVAVIAVIVVLVAAGGSDTAGPGGKKASDLLPTGGKLPASHTSDLKQAIKSAGCSYQTYTVNIGPERHTVNPNERIKYQSNPPAGGKHFQQPADDGAYSQAPPDTYLVHSEEHGRVIIWFKPGLPKSTRAKLRSLFEQDQGFQLLLVPRSNMPYEVAATAWNRDPDPKGTGKVLGCKRTSDAMYDALRAFIEDNRGNGPEVVD
jgi:uncharacterized protein DUF3105